MKISVINFTYVVSKSREYYGCPVVTGILDGVKVREVGYGYDMAVAILSSFINKGLVSQYYLCNSYCNSHFNKSTQLHYVNMSLEEAVALLEAYDYKVKLNYVKGTLV